MRRYRPFVIGFKIVSLFVFLACQSPEAQTVKVIDEPAELDHSKPVPPRADTIKAFQRRQDAIRTATFVWTEQQTHPMGWIPNPRYPESEWMEIPNLFTDRTYTVTKTLTIDGSKMRYSYQLDRKEEVDGVRVQGPGDPTRGLGERKNYVYTSTFDGQAGRITVTSLLDSPPPVARVVTTNIDAQNLDTRAIMMAIRPLDPVMGHLLIERAVPNGSRSFYKGKSIFLLEEQRDPSGWKTILWVEPERGSLVSRFSAFFEQKRMVDVDIDYIEDAQWGWIPSGWRITERLADGSKKLVSEAKVTSYTINQPVAAERFRED